MSQGEFSCIGLILVGQSLLEDTGLCLLYQLFQLFQKREVQGVICSGAGIF